MAFPDITVETSLTTDPLGTPSWEDQSAYVKAVSFRRGREQALEGQFEPATATVGFDNPDRRFDPEHATGPHYGDLVPGKRLRLRATWDSDTYDLFGGFVNGWPQTYRRVASADCVVGATDGFTMLNRTEVGATPFEAVIEQLAPVHWWKLADAESSSTVHDAGSGKVDGSPVGQAAAGLGVVGLDSSSDATALGLDGSPGYVNVAGSLSAWTSLSVLVRVDALPVSSSVIYASPDRLVYINPSGVVYAGDTTDGIATTGVVVSVGATVHLTVVRNGAGDFDIYADGTVEPLSASGAIGTFNLPTIGAGVSSGLPAGFVDGTIQHVALFDAALTADDAASLAAAGTGWTGDTTDARLDRLLDLAGWPTGDRDLDTGTVTLNPLNGANWSDNILDNARLLEATEGGAFYQLPDYTMRFRSRYDHLTAARSTTPQYVFTDAAAGTYHYEDLGFSEQSTYLYNRVKVTWAQGEVVVSDPDSITAYGPREHSVTTILPTAAQARALAEWIIDHYSTPVLRIDSMTLNPAGDERLWEPCLDLRVGDRITVRRHPQQVGTAIEADLIVEGVEAAINQGVNEATFTFSLSAADTVAYWTWDTSTWGETTRWA